MADKARTEMRLSDIAEALQGGRRGVLALVTESFGSAPREAGAALLVTEDGAIGTVGGGTVEARAIEIGRAQLGGGAAAGPRQERFPLGPALDQCCGGAMTVAFGVVEAGDVGHEGVAAWPGGPVYREPALRPAIVYGAGHVGQALVRALAPLPFEITWVDPRLDPFDPALAGLAERCLATPLPEAVAAAAPRNAAHVVATHSHAADLEIVAAALGRAAADPTGAGYVGLIGSATKRAVFERKLRTRGLSEAALARLVCPIGGGLRDKRPAVIAALTVAELLRGGAVAERLPAAAE